MTNSSLRSSIGLLLKVSIYIAEKCHCGKRNKRDGLHSLCCTDFAGRFSRFATLNYLIKQTLGSVNLFATVEPRKLYRIDGKRPDGNTMIPLEMGKQLVWDVTNLNALTQSPDPIGAEISSKEYCIKNTV